MTNAQLSMKDASGTSMSVACTATAPNSSPDQENKSNRSSHTDSPEDIINDLLRDIRHYERKMLEWRLRAAAAYAWARDRLPRREWQRLFTEKRLPIRIRAAQMQCRIGSNVALGGNTLNTFNLPNNIAALSVLADLKPDTISRLCEDDIITSKMTTSQVKAVVWKAIVDEALGKIQPPTIPVPYKSKST